MLIRDVLHLNHIRWWVAQKLWLLCSLIARIGETTANDTRGIEDGHKRSKQRGDECLRKIEGGMYSFLATISLEERQSGGT